MIVTITLNPAVDTSTSVDRFVPEQKLRCEAPRHDAGGGGINVSKAIHRLGGESVALFTSGGYTGLLLEELLTKEQLRYQVIKVESPSRENFIVTETQTNSQYRFGMPGPMLSASEAEACLEALRQCRDVKYVVGSGSLPGGIASDFYAKMASEVKKLGARFILDTSGEPLREAANEGVFLLKPNVGELAKLVGVDKLELSEVDDAALDIINRGNCDVVVVSLGPQGAMLITKEGYEHIPAPPVKKLSTVGAGDSMVGGMVYALWKGKSYAEMVRQGVACGSAATMNPGTELFKKEDVKRLLSWINRSSKSTHSA